MNNDHIAQYKNALNKLLAHKEALEQQIAEVIAALGDAARLPSTASWRAGGARQYGALTAAVIEILKTGPKTKEEIIKALNARDFVFDGNPLRILDSVVYTKHFTRSGKLFSLATPPK